MNSDETKSQIENWIKKYPDSPISKYDEGGVLFHDAFGYHLYEIFIYKLKTENRITIGMSPSTVVEGSREFYLAKELGTRRWKEAILFMVLEYGPVDVEFRDNGDYYLLDYIYDDVFSMDLIHQRARRIVTVQKMIEKKLAILYGKFKGITQEWLHEQL